MSAAKNEVANARVLEGVPTVGGSHDDVAGGDVDDPPVVVDFPPAFQRREQTTGPR
jgi:hypothetical protein